MGNIAKLPKWAQIELNRLEGNVAYWKAKAYQISGTEATDTTVRMSHGNDDLLLPKGSTVKFQTDGGRFEIKTADEGIEIFGQRGLSVHPVVSNHVTLKCESW